MLGARIAVLRRSRGLTQTQMAAALGISPSAVGMYEQGRREPSLDMLVTLSRFFDVSADFLLTGRPLPEEKLRLQNALRERLSDAGQELPSQGRQALSRQELAVFFTALLAES